MFNAILLTKDADGGTAAQLTCLDEWQLPSDGDVLARVEYSTLNYKDALAITGKSPIVRQWPMIPGIDGAGKIIDSAHPDWTPGDAFVLNGWGVGESHMGCLAERARLKGDWLIPLPAGMTTKTAMTIGTAGYTAMLCAMALLEQGLKQTDGKILVTGASGGVGSIAILILSSWGFSVTASTGKMHETDYLHALGATEVIDRAELALEGRPLQKERWSGVIDSVGSYTLANAIAQTKANGVVTACGLAQGMDLPVTVAPFILRGVRLIGINSVTVPRELRITAWKRLAELDLRKLDTIVQEISLAQVMSKAPEVLAGKIRGRLVVRLQN
jgi:acrylyl-CoA reductase (NADPH)